MEPIYVPFSKFKKHNDPSTMSYHVRMNISPIISVLGMNNVFIFRWEKGDQNKAIIWEVDTGLLLGHCSKFKEYTNPWALPEHERMNQATKKAVLGMNYVIWK